MNLFKDISFMIVVSGNYCCQYYCIIISIIVIFIIK